MIQRFGLRTQMAASYVVATVAAVAAVAAVILWLVLPWALSRADLAARVQGQANADAKLLNAQAGVLPGGSPPSAAWKVIIGWVHPSPGSVWLRQPTQVTGPGIGIVATGVPRPAQPVEVLLDTRDRVVASSAPAAFPAGKLLTLSASDPRQTTAGQVTWAVRPIVIGTRQLIGYVYVQAPTSTAGSAGVPRLVLEAVVLVLVIPVGLVFGLFSTRGFIWRLRRLAAATKAVTGGDFGPRLPVSGRDEIGQLEEAFNTMACRLGEAMAGERRSAESSARRAERSRIARELHDSISQDLFSLSLLAAGLRKVLPAGDGLALQAEAMERTAGNAMREMQSLLLELRPVNLAETSLVLALTEMCGAYQARLGIRVVADLGPVQLGPAAEHAVLRVTQEALGNAVKHARAGLISVRLAEAEGQVTVEITDDGGGFDVRGVADRHGMGLRVMRERVEELGGTFRLDSTPGLGTVVAVWLPAAAPPSQPGAAVAAQPAVPAVPLEPKP